MTEKTNDPAGYTYNFKLCAEEVYKDEKGELNRRNGWEIPRKEGMEEIIKGNCEVIKIEDSRERAE